MIREKHGYRGSSVVRCKCGVTKTIQNHYLRDGVKSCGCLGGIRTHGKSNTPLYNVWCSMKQRCSPGSPASSVYFDRGIRVCEEWASSYVVFHDWAMASGWERGLELDRTDNDGSYEPSNCRFVTKIQNANNKSNNVFVVYRNERMPLMDAIRLSGTAVSPTIVRLRIRNGWDHTVAIELPLRTCNRISSKAPHLDTGHGNANGVIGGCTASE